MKDLEKKHLQVIESNVYAYDYIMEIGTPDVVSGKEKAAKQSAKVSLEFAIEQLKQVSKEYGIGLNIIPNNKIQELEKQLKEYE